MFAHMMDRPLLISSIARHAELQHPDGEIVSTMVDAGRHRCTYRHAFSRARRLANALKRLGARHGDRIATLAWNDFRHFEIYYGVSCSGLVCHTINPRLFAEQLIYIINHAEDRWLFLDPAFVPLIAELLPRLPKIEGFVVLTEEAHMPSAQLPRAISYESLIGLESDAFEWPEFDERTASSLCYTSGTTGDPKGVLYSHRSTILHAYSSALPDALGLSATDVVMPVVPMFHVNAWALPYSCPMVGAKLVLPGAKMGDPQLLQMLIETERVTLAAGVPTVWMGLMAYLQKSGKRIDGLRRVLSGGSAVPLALMDQMREHYGVEILHAWGMTELSPVGTICKPSAESARLPLPQREALRAKQGRAIFGIELKVEDGEGKELPRDGKSSGALKARGPWVASSYFRREGDAAFEDGWFDTGDVATIDPLGYLQITDRNKDVIKSGGEWISSIEVENLALAHPAVAHAAAIAIAHPKWQERPLLVIVLKPGVTLSREELLAFYVGKVAKWWIPEDVVFVDRLPLTATGKISKLQLRKEFADYQFTTDRSS